MSAPGKTTSMPLFVPRTVASFERTATQVARRTVGPVRAIGFRAMSFADNIVDGWLSGSRERTLLNPPAPTVMGSSMRVSSAGMTMPRPWYELDSEPQLGVTHRRSAPAAPIAARATVAELPPESPESIQRAAERGASIPLTQLVVAPDAPRPINQSIQAGDDSASRGSSVATSDTLTQAATTVSVPAAPTSPAVGERSNAPTVAPPVAPPLAAPPATPTTTAATHAASTEALVRAHEAARATATAEVARAHETARVTQAAAEEIVRAREAAPVAPAGAPTDSPRVEPAALAGATSQTILSTPVPEQRTRAAAVEARPPALRDERTAAEALGVVGLTNAPPQTFAPAARRAPSAFGRALQHAAWVDAQVASLRAQATATVTSGSAAVATPGYVWVNAAPDAPQARATDGARPFRTPAPIAVTDLSPPPPISERTAAATSVFATPGNAPIAVSPAATTSLVGLPELRLAGDLSSARGATPTATLIARFLDSLVGAGAARDAAVLPVGPMAGRAATFAAPGEAGRATPDAFAIAARSAPGARDRAPAVEYLRLNDPARVGGTPATANLQIPEALERLSTDDRAQVVAAPGAPLGAAPERAIGAAAPVAVFASPPLVRDVLRPGGIGARAEQLAGFVDLRVSASWGEATMSSVAPRAPSLSYVAPLGSPAYVARPNELPGASDARVGETPGFVAATAAAASLGWPAMDLPAELRAVVRQGPARIAQFLDGLVGVDAVRSSAPLSLSLSPMASSFAPSPSVGETAAGENRAALRAPARAPLQLGGESAAVADGGQSVEAAQRSIGQVERSVERLAAAQAQWVAAREAAVVATARQEAAVLAAREAAVMGTTQASAGAASVAAGRARGFATGTLAGGSPPALQMGGVGLRAEQLGGLVGLRASSLAIEFVDPEGLPALTSGRSAPQLSYLWPQAVDGARPSATATAATAGFSRDSASGFAGAGAFASLPSTAQAASGLSAEEWALVATFPSTSTAMQMISARHAGGWRSDGGSTTRLLQQAPAQTMLSLGGGERADVRRSDGPLALRAAERALQGLSRDATAANAVVGATNALRDGNATDAAISAPLEARSVERAAGAPMREYLVAGDEPMRALQAAHAGRPMLPGGRQPRGSFTWPKAAGFAPAAANGESVSTAGSVALEAVEQQSPGSPLWGSMRAMPVVSNGGGAATATTGGGAASGGVAAGSDGAAASSLAQARPLLELVRGGLASLDSTRESVRFTDQPRPLVSAGFGSEAAVKMAEAARQQTSTASSDDRVTLGDLTLISVASASQQVAASPAGGAPAPARPAATPAPTANKAEGGKGGAPSASEVDELAQKVFDELQRLLEIARERSGDPWES